jgi:NAD(P)H-dependent flavin oxidoreductase YrpB (nitropropane dioxygenase family)
MSVSPTVRPTAALLTTDGRLPVVIQGGMGVAVSSWQLARAVSRAGELGVVSGTALDVVIARRLQDGDAGGHVRRALDNFPVPAMAQRMLGTYFLEGGRAAGQPYHPVPKLRMDTPVAGLELSIVANYAEVWLAKEGHDGLVGINFLEKVQMATPSAAYGAMLAGVDYVLMGAGIPAEIPRMLDRLAVHEKCSLDLDVDGATIDYEVGLDPQALTGGGLAPLKRPTFLAIVSAHVLAAYLARDDATRPDGFVVEGPRAGGHNAPRVDGRSWMMTGSRCSVLAMTRTWSRLPLSGCRSGWPVATPRGPRLPRHWRPVPQGFRWARCSRSARSPGWTPPSARS